MVNGSRLRTVHLSLGHKLAARSDRFSDLDGLAIVETHVSFRFPLTLILVETIKITCRVVQKHTLWRQIV